jgi:hypothetical protein
MKTTEDLRVGNIKDKVWTLKITLSDLMKEYMSVQTGSGAHPDSI